MPFAHGLGVDKPFASPMAQCHKQMEDLGFKVDLGHEQPNLKRADPVAAIGVSERWRHSFLVPRGGGFAPTRRRQWATREIATRSGVRLNPKT